MSNNTSNNRGFAAVLVLLVILVLIAGGAWYWSVHKGEVVSSEVTPVAPAGFKMDDGVLPEQNEMAGWKTYVNTKYGFEFKYPSSWLHSELEKGPGVSYEHFICFNPERPAGDCRDALFVVLPYPYTSIWTLEQLKSTYSNFPKTMTWQENGFAYFFAAKSNNSQIFDQIVSTFRFTK